MVRQLSQRNTITIPQKVLEEIGSKPGDLFEIENDGTRIILIPKTIEDKFTELEWKKLGRIVKEKGKLYKNAEDAKKHMKDLTDIGIMQGQWYFNHKKRSNNTCNSDICNRITACKSCKPILYLPW